MGLITSTSTGARPATSIASSRARSRPTCRCRRRPSTRLVHQPQDRQGARPRRAADRARPRRRGDRMKTARVHRAARRRGGGMAARRARAAARADAAHRRAPARSRGRSGMSGPRRGVPAGAGAIGLDHRPQRADRHRWATANAAEIRRHAAELVALAPDVILAHGASTVGPLLQATRTVPIVFPVVADPVGAGFVDSLARPGGNATGFMQFRIQHRAGNGWSCSRRSRRA